MTGEMNVEAMVLVVPLEADRKWTDEDTRALIPWRSSNKALFTRKRNASVMGYEVFIKEKGLGGLAPKLVKKRWENLVHKYKELKNPRTGVSTEGGGVTAASWKWYSLMDEALGARPSVTPPVLFAYREGLEREERRHQETVEREERRFIILRESEERREREAAAREVRREREAAAGEERREREATAREERLLTILEQFTRK